MVATEVSIGGTLLDGLLNKPYPGRIRFLRVILLNRTIWPSPALLPLFRLLHLLFALGGTKDRIHIQSVHLRTNLPFRVNLRDFVKSYVQETLTIRGANCLQTLSEIFCDRGWRKYCDDIKIIPSDLGNNL